MNANTNQEPDGGAVEGAMTNLVVPDDLVQQVLDFIEGLQSEDEDVKGHMLSGALKGGFGGTYSATQTTHTGITTFATGATGTDIKWSDTDSVTLPG
ncbi:MAG: hypothetical protein WBW04_21160 [Nitrolancea sp.]